MYAMIFARDSIRDPCIVHCGQPHAHLCRRGPIAAKLFVNMPHSFRSTVPLSQKRIKKVQNNVLRGRSNQAQSLPFDEG